MKTNQLHFFLLFVSLCVSIIFIPVVHSKCIPDQQQSLLHFKNSLLYNASLSTKLIIWNSSTDCCSWVGVTCSTNGRVLGVDISSESISGGVDNSSSLFHLQNLQSLNLADNYLGNNSSIPSEFGKLMNLRYLNLSDNYYSGKIPIEISRLMRLVVLDISKRFSFLEGGPLEIRNLHMPVENLTKLEELYLDYVQISAEESKWCQAISSSLPNLRVLSLSHCNLTGNINCIPWQNFSNMSSLDLSRNMLNGNIPSALFSLPLLESLYLYDNQFFGHFPEISNC